MIDIYFKCNENVKIPVKAHETDAGFDLYSTEEIMLYPGKQEKFDTGVAVQGRFVDPEDAKKFIIKFQVEGTSGNAAKVGIFPIGGVVDMDYSGIVGVILINSTNDPIKIESGKKIAQLVPEVLPRIRSVHFLEKDEEFEKTERGAAGFGSTGTALS